MVMIIFYLWQVVLVEAVEVAMTIPIKMTALVEEAEVVAPYSFILKELLPFRLLEPLMLSEEMEVTMLEILQKLVKEEEVLVEEFFSNLYRLLVQAVQEHLMLEEVQLDQVAVQEMVVQEE
jgi:DNA-binding transcriptional ArsR family regulator